MTNKKTTIFLLSFFIILSAVFMSYYYKVTHEQKVSLPVYGNPGQHVAPFAFKNQDGRIITNKDVKGKVYVVEYFFTTCKGICPKMNENMTHVYQAFRGNRNVLILSHTVDPLKDTVQAMKEYSQRFDANGDQWMFLTGDKKQLYDMARYSYLINADDDTTGVSIDKDFIHDNHYVLVDGDGRVRGFYDGLKIPEINKLITDINTLLKEDQL
jgi:protein SCO1/2